MKVSVTGGAARARHQKSRHDKARARQAQADDKGREFRFFTDLDQVNILDKLPFFTFDLLDHTEGNLAELAKFDNAGFSKDSILAQAERLKYVSAIRKTLDVWMESPPERLVKLIAPEVHDGRVTAQVRTAIDVDRVHIRDAKSYCAVLLDYNNRKPLARLHFNGRKKCVGLVDGDRQERVAIETLNDMLDFRTRFVATVEKHGGQRLARLLMTPPPLCTHAPNSARALRANSHM